MVAEKLSTYDWCNDESGLPSGAPTTFQQALTIVTELP